MGEKSLNHVMTVKDILNATKGTLITGREDVICDDFSKDSREINKGDIYLGLKGETVNGGIYFENAFANGAKGCIVQDIDFTEEQKEKYKDKVIIKVEDTLNAIQEMAKFKRSLYGKDFPIVAVTGSVGKTSTKDIIASVLSTKYKTLKTEGNNNNHIGVPLTILRLKDHEAAVIEMGMNHFGEIRVLTNIAKPTICVITNIGTSHIGNLGSRENILKSKLEILEGNEQKTIVINNDNDLLHKFYEENNDKLNIMTYGIENASKVYAQDINLEEEKSQFVCKTQSEEFKVDVPVAGVHFVYNALCAITVGRMLNIENSKIQKGIEGFELTKKRMDISTLKNGAKIINDSYNASFESMKASIANLANYAECRKIAVLGDMFELGDYSKQLHENVGKEVAKNNIDILICSGENSKNIVNSAKENGMNENNIYYFENKEDIIKLLNKIMDKNDVILFKASNGMKFFDLVKELEEEMSL